MGGAIFFLKEYRIDNFAVPLHRSYTHHHQLYNITNKIITSIHTIQNKLCRM